ncbi:MAG: hypothetical protein AAFY56_21270 [Pseudomonadota bacterium]
MYDLVGVFPQKINLMIRIEASTRREFHAAVSDAAEAVTKAGGWIVSHQFFSNSLAVISLEIPAAALPKFGATLASATIKVHQDLPRLEDKTGEVPVQLSITFQHGGPDQRRPVPAFG